MVVLHLCTTASGIHCLRCPASPLEDDVPIPFPLLLFFKFVLNPQNPQLKDTKFSLHGGLLNFVLAKVAVFYCACGENNLSPFPHPFLA